MSDEVTYTWQGWLDTAHPGDEPFGRSARIELGTAPITKADLLARAAEAGVPVDVVELPMHPTAVGRIIAIDSAGPPGSASRDGTGISVGPTHTGTLLVHLGRATQDGEPYLAQDAT